MTKKEFFEEIKSIVDTKRELCEMARQELRVLEEKKRSGDYSDKHIWEVTDPAIAKAKKEIDDHKASAKDLVRSMAEKVKRSNHERDLLRGEDLTDDARLLQGDLPLTADDVQGIIDRNAGNRTMLLLAHRYAEQKGLQVHSTYLRATAENQAIDTVCADIDRVISYFGDDAHCGKVYDAVFGEGAQAAQFCNSDSEIAELYR